ncbi:hypothetical protein CCP2SC5_840008 [Azospirillaceae bacterium]
MIYSYAQVSTDGQSIEAQTGALTALRLRYFFLSMILVFLTSKHKVNSERKHP